MNEGENGTKAKRFEPRTCPVCGKTFTPNWNTRKFCSDACYKVHEKQERVGRYVKLDPKAAMLKRQLIATERSCALLKDKADRLEVVNGSLCAEINRQERRIRELERDWTSACDSRARWQEKAVDMEGRCIELESLLRDVWAAYSEKADGSFHPAWEVESGLKERMRALGLGVDK